MSRVPGSGIRRVLVIGPSNIGDALLAGDVIADLCRRYPQAHLTVVVGERAKRLFVEDPRIQTLVDADAFSSPLGVLRLALALWRHRPQVLVDLRHTLYPLLLKPWSLWRYLVQPPRRIVHMRERHLWKLRRQAPGAASAGAPDGFPLWCSPKDNAHVDGLWTRWQLRADRPLVVISPGARSHIKRWTAEGFAWVADRLLTDAAAQVVFVGEPDEEPVVDEILGLMRQRAFSAVGLTTIRQSAELMRRAWLVITNDSASLHAASALRVPTVAIFGPTDERKYGPTAPAHRVIRRQLFCTPCERALCRFNHECMRFIAPEDVFRAAADLLSAHA